MNDVRVLIATGIYPPEIGGPATHTKLLEEKLPEHGCSVSVLMFRSVRSWPKVLRHVVFFLKVFAWGRKQDVIFAQDTVSVGFPALLAAKLLGKPFVVRVPGDYAWEQAQQRFGVIDSVDDFQGKSYGVRVGVLRFFQERVVRGAARVVTPSNYFKDLVSGWGVPKERIETIYNGIDLDVEAVMPKDVPPKPFMVSAGRLVPWKGFEMLIRLLPRLPGWSLVIIGDGPLRGELESCAKKVRVSERVFFTGSIPRPELFGWLRTSSAFVLNTSFESFSFQVVEAMSLGVPVVTTSVGSIPELIENGKEGILLEPNEEDAFLSALGSVSSKEEVWSKRCTAAQERSKDFSIEKTVDSFAQLFKHVR